MRLWKFTFHYAYTVAIRIFCQTQTYLHSTMLLLILPTDTLHHIPNDYLHSTMLLLILCTAPLPYLSALSFTFHYASTYTKPYFLEQSISELFTFHYASTYTVYQSVDKLICKRIYIPLCFYLYRPAVHFTYLPHKFTFHYASTYTNTFQSLLL